MDLKKTEHTVQVAAFIALLVMLWWLFQHFKKGHAANVQQTPATAAGATNPTLSFGSPQIPGYQPGSIDIGGTPLYFNYNYPPADNPYAPGVTSAQGDQTAGAPTPPTSGCSGCCSSCNDCAKTQVASTGAQYIPYLSIG